MTCTNLYTPADAPIRKFTSAQLSASAPTASSIFIYKWQCFVLVSDLLFNLHSHCLQNYTDACIAGAAITRSTSAPSQQPTQTAQ